MQKASDLIRNIQSHIDEYGDLPVQINVHIDEEEQKTASKTAGGLFTFDAVCVRYDEYEEKDGGEKITISSFPY